MKAINMQGANERREVLHYVGYDDDKGGIVSVVRALAGAGLFRCVLGVNPGFRPSSPSSLDLLELPATTGESLGIGSVLSSHRVAKAVRLWLQADPRRVFHGHSRAGLAVSLWLVRWEPGRVVVSVHCYGRQRWLYRWAEGRLGGRLFWLSPAMKRYYKPEAAAGSWDRCIPGCITLGTGGQGIRSRSDGDLIRLAGIGAVVAWKQWHLVLDALHWLPAAVRSRFRFTHIGSTDGTVESERYAASLRERTSELGLESIVEWRGQQPSASGVLSASDCVVIPSRNEPFSVAMLEALEQGVPVLAADSGGAQDVIRPGLNGWLFRSGDKDSLGEALSSLAEAGAFVHLRIDPAEVARFGAAQVAKQWNEVYSALPELQ